MKLWKFPSRRAGLLFFHQRKCIPALSWTWTSFHPGERDCCFSTIVNILVTKGGTMLFPSRRAGLLFFHHIRSYPNGSPHIRFPSRRAGLLFFHCGTLQSICREASIPASGIVVFPRILRVQLIDNQAATVSIPASGIVGERGSPWQLPNGNCFLIASSSLHTGAVCAKRKLQSVGAKRPKPFLPVTGRFAPPSLGYKSRRAGLLYFHHRMGRR
jgi:hypothetical protein